MASLRSPISYYPEAHPPYFSLPRPPDSISVISRISDPVPVSQSVPDPVFIAQSVPDRVLPMPAPAARSLSSQSQPSFPAPRIRIFNDNYCALYAVLEIVPPSLRRMCRVVVPPPKPEEVLSQKELSESVSRVRANLAFWSRHVLSECASSVHANLRQAFDPDARLPPPPTDPTVARAIRRLEGLEIALCITAVSQDHVLVQCDVPDAHSSFILRFRPHRSGVPTYPIVGQPRSQTVKQSRRTSTSSPQPVPLSRAPDHSSPPVDPSDPVSSVQFFEATYVAQPEGRSACIPSVSDMPPPTRKTSPAHPTALTPSAPVPVTADNVSSPEPLRPRPTPSPPVAYAEPYILRDYPSVDPFGWGEVIPTAVSSVAELKSTPALQSLVAPTSSAADVPDSAAVTLCDSNVTVVAPAPLSRFSSGTLVHPVASASDDRSSSVADADVTSNAEYVRATRASIRDRGDKPATGPQHKLEHATALSVPFASVQTPSPTSLSKSPRASLTPSSEPVSDVVTSSGTAHPHQRTVLESLRHTDVPTREPFCLFALSTLR